MSQYTKYKLYKLQQRISGSSDAWVDVVPTTYSYDGNGTQTPVVVESASTDCGYTPPVEPMYKWVTIPISQDYYCDECVDVNYKVKLYYTNDNEYTVPCNSSLYLFNYEIQNEYDYKLISAATIGECTEILSATFSGCTSLSNITIPNNVIEIGGRVFSGCTSLANITIPNSVTKIGNYAFDSCTSLTSITIPSSVTIINTGVFSDCSGLTSVGLVGSGSSVEIPSSVTSIKYTAFIGCSGLTSVNIPDNVISIGSQAFMFCRGLTSVNIGNGVTSIGNDAFFNCSSLTNITIGSGVTSIGNDAFYNLADEVATITIKAVAPPTLGTNALWYKSIIYVPSESVNIYKSNSSWNEYVDKIFPIPNS